MITVSLCMIVRDEEFVIGRCLESVKDVVDEIILVDTGSTDRTKEICRKFTDNIYDFKWIDDFAAARNYSFSLATKDYILWLDADDVLPEEEKENFIRLKETLPSYVDCVDTNYVLQKDEYGNVVTAINRVRLTKRESNMKWIGFIHEAIDILDKKLLKYEINILHKPEIPHPHRNLGIFNKKKEAGYEFSARDLYFYANELFVNKRVEEAIQVYKEYLELEIPWSETHSEVCWRLSDIYYSKNDPEQEILYLFKPLSHVIPNAETCCRIGFLFALKNQWKESIFWYKIASEMKKPELTTHIIMNGCWTWLPHYQMAIAYFNSFDFQKAKEHIQIALTFRPSDEKILEVKRVIEEQLILIKDRNNG